MQCHRMAVQFLIGLLLLVVHAQSRSTGADCDSVRGIVAQIQKANNGKRKPTKQELHDRLKSVMGIIQSSSSDRPSFDLVCSVRFYAAATYAHPSPSKAENRRLLDMATGICNDSLPNNAKDDAERVLLRKECDLLREQQKVADDASLRRRFDEVYDEGRGSLTHSVALTEALLDTKPRDAAQIRHRLGVLRLLQCELDASEACVRTAVDILRRSTAEAAQEAIRDGALSPPPWTIRQCDNPDFIIHLPRWLSNNHHHRFPGSELMEWNGVTLVMGRDGVMHNAAAFGPCFLVVRNYHYLSEPSGHVLLHYGRTAQRRDPPTVVTVPTDSKLLNVVGFAAASYYHWMCEALVAAVQFLQHEGSATTSQLWILVPTLPDKTTPRFVTESVDLMCLYFHATCRVVAHKHSRGDTIVSGRMVTVVFSAEAIMADDTPPLGVGSWVLDVLPVAAPSALRTARDALRGAMTLKVDGSPGLRATSCVSSASGGSTREIVVIVAERGARTTMRRWNESLLVDALQPLVEGRRVSVRRFAAQSNSWEDDVKLFVAADVIVGVHGGALANIICARSGASVVEIGLRSPSTKMYEFVSGALGLRYRRVLVAEDEAGRGVAAPSISVDLTSVLSVVWDEILFQLETVDSGRTADSCSL